MKRILPDGLYEHLLTEELAELLAILDSGRTASVDQVLDGDAHIVLSRHVGREVERVIAALPADNRAEAARKVVDGILESLAALGAKHGAEVEALEQQRVPPPVRRLLSLHRVRSPERPVTPLAISTLLTRNAAEPAIGHELAREIASSDRIDVVVAFVTMGGIRRIRDALEDFSRRPGAQLRLLTTTFTGTTEREALDQLAALPGVTVKISYDVRRTRLHAKAWLFHRDSGLSTAYVGSANLTATALGEGHEWMVKVCAADLPHVIEKFDGTFETLWLDPEFEAYDPRDQTQRERLAAALGAERKAEAATTLVELRPYPFQEEILDRLTTARLVHGRRRNLIVAATGTGKTVVAAVDYARLAAASGHRPRLLFLAHRREILERSRDTFRHALQDGSFGELAVAGQVPNKFDHVFASIQGAANLIDRVGPAHFRHVVVDECHHLPAKSYQDVIPRLEPDQLVGLTATPERQDGKSLLPDFDGRVAAELRLWHALDRQLLVPFDYYGISDGTDLRHVRWSRTGYDASELASLYTGHAARADLVLAQLGRRVANPNRIRALGFCVSVEHAEFMAQHFSKHGLPALAVHGDTPDDIRVDAPRRLREREVNILFTCDLYNEGVDLPFVDTLLFLRPTMSATLFMQQLGRGLRLDPASKKTSCLVLDFIGQHRSEFRFDSTLSALTGVPRPRLKEAVVGGFPFLPSGCSVVLDAVARDAVVGSLKVVLGGARRLADELREMSRDGTQIRLAEFLEKSGRELDEVYTSDFGWAKVRSLAGVIDADEDAEDLSRRLGWLGHVDEPRRLNLYANPLPPKSEEDRVRWHMLEYQLNHRGVLRAAEDTVAYIVERPRACEEIRELNEVLSERVVLPTDKYPVAGWPLALHRHYERREIVAAVGFVEPGQKGKLPQGGILRLPNQKRELLFVTLDKSGKGFSPTTRYRDYAVSRDLFHWETQGAASVSRASGRRYIEPQDGWSFYLFTRRNPDSAYAFLGPVHYVSHRGDRPIGITWRLEAPMPAGLFESFATLASG